jgi:hypothetical protein
MYIGHILNIKFNEKIWAFQFHFDRNSATKIFVAPRWSLMFQFHYNLRSTKMFNAPWLLFFYGHAQKLRVELKWQRKTRYT